MASTKLVVENWQLKTLVAHLAAAEAASRPTARTYEVRHTRRARKNDETASTIDRYGREDTSGIERARVQNYRWKPSVVIGHG